MLMEQRLHVDDLLIQGTRQTAFHGLSIDSLNGCDDMSLGWEQSWGNRVFQSSPHIELFYLGVAASVLARAEC